MIPNIGVSAGQIDSQISTGQLQSANQTGLKGFQVVRIFGPILQLDVEVAQLFVKGEVARSVDGEGENGGVFGQNGRRTVALVHVAINDHHPPYMAFGLHSPGSDDAVVKHTVSLAVVTEGVVGASGQADGHPIPQRGPAGSDGAAHRTTGAGHQFGRPGQADAPHLFGRKLALYHPLQVVIVVGTQDLFIGRRFGHNHIFGRHQAGRHHSLPQENVLLDGETVSRR